MAEGISEEPFFPDLYPELSQARGDLTRSRLDYIYRGDRFAEQMAKDTESYCASLVEVVGGLEDPDMGNGGGLSTFLHSEHLARMNPVFDTVNETHGFKLYALFGGAVGAQLFKAYAANRFGIEALNLPVGVYARNWLFLTWLAEIINEDDSAMRSPFLSTSASVEEYIEEVLNQENEAILGEIRPRVRKRKRIINGLALGGVAIAAM